MSNCDFTCSHYENILDQINESDYKVKFFNNLNSNDRELILRHDVDVDLEKAYSMALMENRHGIGSTYFVSVRSPFYNILDRSNSDLVRGISDLGHQIGLHFDEACCRPQDAECITKGVDAEVQILRDFLNTEIFAVSFHRPSKFILQSDIKLNQSLINTYDKNFTKEIKYVSDSRRMWKEGCLCGLLKNPGPVNDGSNRIQALVHPIWWTDKGLSAQETIEKFLIAKFKHLDLDLGKNIEIYERLL